MLFQKFPQHLSMFSPNIHSSTDEVWNMLSMFSIHIFGSHAPQPRSRSGTHLPMVLRLMHSSIMITQQYASPWGSPTHALLDHDREVVRISMWLSKHALFDHDRGSKHVLHVVLHTALQTHAPRSIPKIRMCSPCNSPNMHSSATIEDWNMFFMWFFKTCDPWL